MISLGALYGDPFYKRVLPVPWFNAPSLAEICVAFEQEEKECILQDMNRVYAFCAFAFSCFIAQLSFVLKWHFFEDAHSASGKNCLDLLTSASLEAIVTRVPRKNWKRAQG